MAATPVDLELMDQAIKEDCYAAQNTVLLRNVRIITYKGGRIQVKYTWNKDHIFRKVFAIDRGQRTLTSHTQAAFR